jgi:ubiquinone/menaquinone biosynthesis C-methylase UbiE
MLPLPRRSRPTRNTIFVSSARFCSLNTTMQRDPRTVEAEGAIAARAPTSWMWAALHATLEHVATEIRRRADRLAYRAQQTAIRVPLATTRALVSALIGGESPDPAAVAALRERYEGLLARDLANVEAGLYPRSLLYQIPVATYARTLPMLLLDVPRVLRRVLARDHEDLPADVDLQRYPSYFRRNFHWQSDGYLSRRSAELYDLAVELLFAGTSDVMRRQVIPPISRFLGNAAGTDVRLLDVACGTGRALAQIACAHPRLRLYGLDLSPYYLQVARRVLADLPDVSLVAENAERLPFRAGYFDVVTSVFLFHELPRSARRMVLAEMHRVLRPGGLLVIEDSAQLAESGDVAFFLGRFAAEFHEPFYRDYVRDDLAAALTAAGFRVESVEPHFVSKVVVGRKLAGARGPLSIHRGVAMRRRSHARPDAD